MADTDIQFMVEGPDASEAAKALSELIQKQFNHEVEPMPAPGGYSGPGKKIDPALLNAGLKMAALIVAIPASALAVLNFKDRLGEKKAKAEKLAKGTEAIEEKHPGVEIRIRKPDGTLIQAKGLDANTLMDIFTAANR